MGFDLRGRVVNEYQEPVDVPTRTTLEIARGKFMVVVSGLVAVEHRASIGRTLLAIVGVNEIFPCSSRGTVVRRAHGRCSATVAVADAGQISEQRRQQAVENQIRTLSFRICILRLDTRDRIATGLAFLALMVGARRTRNMFELPRISQQYLADFCSCTRCTVVDHLRALEEAGMVVRSETGLVVRMESPRVWGPKATGSYFWTKRH